MADNAVWWESLCRPVLEVGHHGLEHLPAGAWQGNVITAERIGFGKKVGMLIGGPPEHGAIDVLEMRCGLCEGRDAAIDLDTECGEICFETIHVVVAQGWYGAVIPWTQAME